MRYSKAVRYLDSFSNFEHRAQFSYRREMNLARIRILLDRFGHPEKKFKSILVAGTKGKGSTACFLHSILAASGYRAGLYTSPHLSDFRERIRVNGALISKKALARLLSRIQRTIGNHHRLSGARRKSFTYFEISTLLALLYFAETKVDFAVLEVGMGGRLDATCAVTPVLSVLTPISVDHEEHLGRTLSRIAREKSGIIRRRTPFVSARQPQDAERVFRRRSNGMRAPGYFLGRDFEYQNPFLNIHGSRFNFRFGSYCLTDCAIRLPGTFQIENASVALAAFYILHQKSRIRPHSEQIKTGLLKSFWPGRFEVIQKHGRTFVVDGAHNGASMRSLFYNMKRLFPGREIVTIFGTSREKKLEAMFPVMGRLSEAVILTQSAHPRAQDFKALLETGKSYLREMVPAPDVHEAIRQACVVSKARSIIALTGSLFLAGEGREILKHDNRFG